MNVKRFTARTSREAFALVRQAFGEDAVVLSTKPCPEGMEVLAMAQDSVEHFEKVSSPNSRGDLATRAERQTAERPLAGRRLAERLQQTAPAMDPEVERDVAQLSMSTLSFQDYVRERMLKRRQAAITGAEAPMAMPAMATAPQPAKPAAPAPRAATPRPQVAARMASITPAPRDFEPSELRAMPALAEPQGERREQLDMVHELRAMKGLIEERFGALAFMEKLQRHPRQAHLAQKLLDCSFSPGLIRKLVEALPPNANDESAWAASVLERNLLTGEQDPALEEQGGVYALIGSTGVGKTTSTAKLAAAFATRYGAANLGLITLDAYRVGAHEQLRTYGRILGVPVHTAHDRASLEDLLELLAGKKMVLIDTAGMAQRDSRTKELLEMLSHTSIQRLLVVDASSQGETIDDVINAWRAARCKGVILSKIDEAVKLAPALDAVIRHKLKVWGVANGQRVPEDWHRLTSNALVQRALKGGGAAAYRMEADDVQLVFAASQHHGLVSHVLHA
ncbi:MAG: flagellar biosynthesis protein FlhF [Burkholderiales bacterium]|nr:flagellar biosynthesis protein FlhF [Burkholderiales bacterium]